MSSPRVLGWRTEANPGLDKAVPRAACIAEADPGPTPLGYNAVRPEATRAALGRYRHVL